MATILQLEGVSKRFGGLMALQDINFSVHEGEIFGIIGPNGSGKTTLLNLISHMDAPTTGKVIYQGEDLVGYAPSRICKMGLVRTFQSTVSFSESTVWENLIRAQLGHTFSGLWSEFLITREVREKKKIMTGKAKELISFFGLEAFTDSQARALPYGLQKLLGLGMAMAGDPRLLMLDEPAAGLNLEERSRLVNSIQRINGNGVTVMLVEHDMKVIMGLCQRILVINYGQRIALGTPSEVQQNEDVVRAYLGEDYERA